MALAISFSPAVIPIIASESDATVPPQASVPGNVPDGIIASANLDIESANFSYVVFICYCFSLAIIIASAKA